MTEYNKCYRKAQITTGLIEWRILHLNWKWKALVSYFRHDRSCLSQILLETVLTVITCQFLNHELQIPAALCLACHILFRLLALTVTVICLQCVQILYKTPRSKITAIKTFLKNKSLRKKKTFLPLLLKNTLSFCCSCHTDPTFTYFRNCRDSCGSEHPCKAVFVLTHSAVQHQVLLQRGFDVSGLLWGGCKTLQSHKPGVYSAQVDSQLHKMSSL